MIVSFQTQVKRDASARLVATNGERLQILTDMISRVGQMVAQRILERAYREAEKKLMGLDDRMLRDIGLNHCEIASAVRNAGHRRYS
jgi:hypothetical protein